MLLRRRNAAAANAVMVALTLSGCRLEPPAMPGKDVTGRAELEASGRRAQIAADQADAAVRTAKQEQAAAAAAVQGLEAEAAVDGQRAADDYAQAIAEAEVGANGCRLAVERLIALQRYLGEFAAEPRRDAALAGLEPCRKEALKSRRKQLEQAQRERPRGSARLDIEGTLRDEGLSAPWVPVRSGPTPTPGREDMSRGTETPALASARADLAGAGQAVTAAEADLQRAQQDVADNAARVTKLDAAEDARETAWRKELNDSGNRYVAAAGGFGVGAAVGLGVGFFFLGRGEAIENGKGTYPTNAARYADVKDMHTRSVAFFIVALPFAVASIVAAHYALRRFALGKPRLSATAGGLELRF